MIKVKLMCTLLSVLFCSTLFAKDVLAQGLCEPYHFRIDKIKGRVVSDGPKGDEPIPNAKIELRRIKDNLKIEVIKTVFSSNEGFFDLGKIKKGKYQIAVSQEELNFIDFFFGITRAERKKILKNEEYLYIKLGVSVLKPCGGGKAKLVEN